MHWDLRALSNHRDRAYSLSLRVRLVVYNLAPKALGAASPPDETGLARTLGLRWSDGFFNLRYALLGIALSSYAAFLGRPW